MLMLIWVIYSIRHTQSHVILVYSIFEAAHSHYGTWALGAAASLLHACIQSPLHYRTLGYCLPHPIAIPWCLMLLAWRQQLLRGQFMGQLQHVIRRLPGRLGVLLVGALSAEIHQVAWALAGLISPPSYQPLFLCFPGCCIYCCYIACTHLVHYLILSTYSDSLHMLSLLLFDYELLVLLEHLGFEFQHFAFFL